MWVPDSREPVRGRCVQSRLPESCCSPRCIFSVINAIITGGLYHEPLLPLINIKSFSFSSWRSHCISVAVTATGRITLEKKMHILLTDFTFSFTLNFTLLSSAAFLRNGNKHRQDPPSAHRLPIVYYAQFGNLCAGVHLGVCSSLSSGL